MWNKLIISLLLLLGNQAAFSQMWLNKTDKDILQYISDNKERIEDTNRTETLFILTEQVEDELGRLFKVSYRFYLEDHTCISYERSLPAHRYWATTLLEEVSLQEAEGSGNEINIDGEILNEVYTFDNYQIRLSRKEDRFILFYSKCTP